VISCCHHYYSQYFDLAGYHENWLFRNIGKRFKSKC